MITRILVETYSKDPDEKLDYGFDWEQALDGDTIAASAWTVPTGITQSTSPVPTFNDTTTTIWLEAGTAGEKYIIVNRITTAAGRIFEASFRVSVRSSG
jgi:hypothetical protein